MNMAYIRVSSKHQCIDRQLVKMKNLGIEDRFIFIDFQSGKDFDRQQYKTLRTVIRKGDVIYIDALDRLGRNYEEIIKEWKYITREIEADIIVLENATLFDSRKFKGMETMGRLMEDQFLSLLAYVADQERKKILQRQNEGIAAAKARGKHLGRPKLNIESLSDTQRKTLKNNYVKWKTKDISGVHFAELLDLKKNSFYKIIKEYEGYQKMNNWSIKGE